MAKITFPDSFLAYTDSVREYETHTTVYRDLELELKKKYPGIENELDKSSLALDGQIYPVSYTNCSCQESTLSW